MLGALAAGRATGLALALALAGCVSMTGPCRIERDPDTRALVECEQGGSAAILAPARMIEAAASAAQSPSQPRKRDAD